MEFITAILDSTTLDARNPCKCFVNEVVIFDCCSHKNRSKPNFTQLDDTVNMCEITVKSTHYFNYQFTHDLSIISSIICYLDSDQRVEHLRGSESM